MSFNLNSKETIVVNLLKKRDQQGLKMAYRDYGNAVYGIIFRILKVEEVAEEVLQDVFVKVWENIDSYDPDKGKFFTWLATIAKRLAIDHTRSARYKQGKKTETIDRSVYKDRWSEELNIKDTGLHNVVNSLDEKYRLLIDLVYFNGYTHQEVHQETNIPLGTVKTRLRKAMSELRRILNNAPLVDIIAIILLNYII